MARNLRKRSELSKLRNLARGYARTPDKARVKLGSSARLALSADLYGPYLKWLGASWPQHRKLLESLGSPVLVGDYGLLQLFKEYEPLPLEAEVAWQSALLAGSIAALRDFRALASGFARAVLLGAAAEAKALLDEIEERFGVSCWLIENRIALLETTAGTEESRAFVNRVNSEAPDSFAALLAAAISERNEPTVSLGRFSARKESEFRSPQLPGELSTYLMYKTTGSLPSGLGDLSDLLRLESTVCLIDTYETLVQIAVHLYARLGAGSYVDRLLPHLGALAAVGDFRLQKLLYLVQSDVTALARLPPHDPSADDLLAEGRFAEAAELSRQLMARFPSDSGHLLTQARALALGGSAQPTGPGLWATLATAVARVLSAGEQYESALQDLRKTAVNFRALPQCLALWGLAGFEQGLEALEVQRLARYTALSRPEFSASDACALPGDWRPYHLDACRARYPGSGSVRLEGLRAGLAEDPAGIEAGLLHQAATHSSLLRRDTEAAIVSLTPQMASQHPAIRRNATKVALVGLSEQGRLGEALELIARASTREPHMVRVLPIQHVFHQHPWDLLSSQTGSLALPVCVSLLMELEDQSEHKRRLRRTWHDFLLRGGLTRPSELFAQADRHDRGLLIHYLWHVSTPAIMSVSPDFDSGREIREERIRVCSGLIELDPGNASRYKTEILWVTKELKVFEGLRHLENTRVYIDVESLKPWARRELGELFERYTRLAVIEVDLPKVSVATALAQFIVDRQPLAESLSVVEDTEANRVLGQILSTLRHQLLFHPRHGLEFYLSSRVRHGVIGGRLRAPVQSRDLLTTRDEGSQRYSPDSPWIERIEHTSPEQRQAVGEAFATFSEGYNAEINQLVKAKLHVRSAGHPEGLIDMDALNSPLVFNLIGEKLRQVETFDDFYEAATAYSSASIGPSLEAVQRTLREEVKPRLLDAIRQLESRISSCLRPEQYGELRAALRSASTELQDTVDAVSRWFKLGSAEDLSVGFEIGDIVDIAVQSVKLCNKGFEPQLETDYRVTQQWGAAMLSELSDILFIALSNVAEHSKVGPSPWASISVVEHTERGELEVRVHSQVADGVFNPAGVRELEQIKGEILAKTYASKAQGEGKTGLIKISNILSQHQSHSLDFGFLGPSEFFVHLSMSFLYYQPYELPAAGPQKEPV